MKVWALKKDKKYYNGFDFGPMVLAEFFQTKKSLLRLCKPLEGEQIVKIEMKEIENGR